MKRPNPLAQILAPDPEWDGEAFARAVREHIMRDEPEEIPDWFRATFDPPPTTEEKQ